jgi:hypothetical protein
VIIKLKQDNDTPTSLTSIQYLSKHEILEIIVVGVDCNWMNSSFKKMTLLLERVVNG